MPRIFRKYDMKALKEFSLPIKGLGIGIRKFNFELDNDFYKNFDSSTIQNGNIKLELVLDKRTDMIVLDFDFRGTVQVACDRCLEQIQLPIEGHQELMIKYNENTSEDADIVFISPYETELNVARYIYEFTSLAVPMKKVYDCENDENAPCDSTMLQYLEQEEKEEDSDTENPIWDSLKNFNKNN